MYDDPIKHSDPMGDEGEACCGGFIDGLLEGGKKILISASGMLDGALNTASGGLISSDPFNFRSKLSDEDKGWFDGGVRVGQIVPLVMPGTSSGEGASLQPVNGPSESVAIPVTLKPVLVPMSNTSQGTGNDKKKSSNEKLVEASKTQKAKEQKSEVRAQTRREASAQGKRKEGKSNQETRGSHNNTKNGGGRAKLNDHEEANARRAKERKAADERRKKN